MNVPARDLSPIQFSDTSDPPFLPASFPVGKAWYCVYVSCKSETRARMGIESIGHECFLPLEKKWVRHARYKKEVLRPLFSRYLFVRFDINKDSWWPINSVDGVERILGNDGIPSSVPGHLIATLKSAQEIGLFDETTAVKRLNKGDPVKVIAGPFRGFIAQLTSTDDGKGKVEALLQILGRGTVLKFSLCHVRPA